MSNEKLADEMFLAFLSRFPRPEERRVAANRLESRRTESVEDLAWSLVNKVEFIHNY